MPVVEQGGVITPAKRPAQAALDSVESGWPSAGRETARTILTPVLYPAAVVAVFLGQLYLGAGVHIMAAIRIVVIAGLLALLVTVVANVVVRDRHRGGLIALIVMMALITTAGIATVVLLFAAAIIAAERIATRHRGSRLPWPVVTRVMGVVGAILVLAILVKAVQEGGASRIVADLRPPTASAAAAGAIATDRPDIYVLLLDGHLRADHLLTLFGSDASPFVDGLTEMGLHVSSGSRSNYLVTTESVPTLLNMRHLDDLSRDRGPVPTDRTAFQVWTRNLINDATALDILRVQGYEIDAISPGFEHVTMRHADRFIDTGEMNEFEAAVIRSTALSPVLEAIDPAFMSDQVRARVLSEFNAVAGIAGEHQARPRFVYAHIPSPHAPFVFGRDGQTIPPPDPAVFYDDTAAGRGMSREDFGRLYADQASYIDALALKAVKEILARSETPPVILVLSDHGSGSGLMWWDIDHSDVDERSANFFAANTPGHRDLFGDRPTLINTFPTLFNAYFSTSIPLQPNTIYQPLDLFAAVKAVDEAKIARP